MFKILLENISGEIVGDAVKGNSYYRNTSNYTTLHVDLATTLNATLRIEASLVEEPEDDDWVDVTPALAISGINSYVIPGNFVWIRATVTDYLAGTINSVKINY